MGKTFICTAPGRTEIGGNHTDHQHGCVLAAAVDLRTRADIRPNGTDRIRVYSEGYEPVEICLDRLQRREEEANTTAALVRGMAAEFRTRGASLFGFDAHVTSDVLSGSGLSSSAAFEVMLGTAMNGLFFHGRLSAVEIAKMSQRVENVYFGKPCGLMDQMASSVGGLVFMDFADPTAPVVERLDFDFAAAGCALCVVDSGADHADLTADYAAIPHELRQLCGLFGKTVLREIPEAQFFDRLPWLHGQVPDRALLRAIHVYGENRRVLQQVQALRAQDPDTFLRLVTESGRSSWMYLQNITPVHAVRHQALALTLALCDTLLQGEGAYRVHGGGFAGTVLAFVPLTRLEQFRGGMERVLGAGCCHVLSVSGTGGTFEEKSM